MFYMSEIDDFLTTVGISHTEEENTPQTPTVQSMPDEAFDEVLNSLGFNEEEPEYDEQAGEGYVESIENREEPTLIEEETPEELIREDSVLSDIRTETEVRAEAEEIRNQDSEVRVEATPIGEALERTIESLAAAHDTNSTETAQTEDSNHIEPNSPTLLMDETTSRFSGTEWYDEIRKKSVILAGLGGIGSHFCLQLARMNINRLVIYDNDIVETANMSGQLYGISDIGKTKVDAMGNAINNYTSMRNVFAINERFTDSTDAGDIMICGFDNMEARKTFFWSWERHVSELPDSERKNCLFIDGRLSVSELQVFCIRGNDEYNKVVYAREWLFDDREAENTVCSMKQTTYLASMIGSIMVNLFTNWVAESLNPVMPYDVPFFTSYDAQNMIFNTES